jgi:hypothetical protein
MAALLITAVAGCAPPPNDFLVVHHRANGCDPTATENSLAGARCVVAACEAGSAPCALEGDARIVRVKGGSLGDDLEIVWIHDGSTSRTADCGDDAIAIPGDEPASPERLAACRLVRPDGSLSDEAIPTLDEALATLAGSPVTLFLELKTVGDPLLDARLVEGAAAKLGELSERTVFASFDSGALTRARELIPSAPTACFAPSGGAGAQVLKVLSGEILSDVDACIRAGHTYVFVPPNFIDASVVGHALHGGAGLGTFGADTATAFDSVQDWAHRLAVVYADHPSMFRDLR